MGLPRLLQGAAIALLLAACAGYSPRNLPPGATQAEVVHLMGPPTGRYAMPQGGTRLEFARGPYGRETKRMQKVMYDHSAEKGPGKRPC